MIKQNDEALLNTNLFSYVEWGPILGLNTWTLQNNKVVSNIDSLELESVAQFFKSNKNIEVLMY